MSTGAAATLLDDLSVSGRLDPSGVLSLIEALPEQFESAWAAARAFDWPDLGSNVRQVLVLGMGGSAIAGDIVSSLASLSGSKPAAVVRGYDVPAYVDGDTLVVACSHSGNTEESVSALEQSLERGARAVVVTTGGRLADLARERQLPGFIYSYDGMPRCAIGHQLAALIALAERIGLVQEQHQAMTEAIASMRAQRPALIPACASSSNPAKQLAQRLHGRVPVIVAGGLLADAAHRWKTQVNENSKSWAFWDELPEMDHNSVVGFSLPPALVEDLHVSFLLPSPIERRAEVRYEATAAELSRAGVAHERVDIPGDTPLAQVLHAVYLGDFVSYYLAMLNGVDPAPIDPITRVKQRLAQP